MLNIFQNREASKKFVQLSSELKGQDKKKFSGTVKALFVKKTVSPDGQYSTFKVTTDELEHLFTLAKQK